ncbi:NAD(P)H-dependent flavin oxidoreductase [Streptomyces sp. DT224]|uniref:NAD(P)H-dependent flavin oxidoreductase n=1 Tax=Streptomyces sp. DT224 TaxID=3393426 RepID=UPI003CF20B94
MTILPAVLRERLRLPVMAAPMFLVSGPELVIAQSLAGVIGSFPTLNARPQEVLSDWLDQIGETLADHDADHPERPAAPYAVNLVVHRTNTRLEADLADVCAHRVPIVVTSLGARPEVNEAVHAYGGLVLHDVTSDDFARKAIAKGADGLIAVAAGAGGHAGAQSPFALLNEIRAWFDGPLLLSGAMAHGRSLLAAEAAGADLAYVGSAFLATDEAAAAPRYKEMVVAASARDIVTSATFTGIPANYLRPSIEAVGLDPDRLTAPDGSAPAWDGGTGEIRAWRDVWGAGQGVGSVDAVRPVAGLVDRLAAQYEEARAALLARP